MAILWQPAPTPFIDANGNPYVGAKAYFFDANTTSPRTVYRDSGLGVSHDHPVVANAAGIFPAVFLPGGDYRLRVTDAFGVTIWDVDGITAPTASLSADTGAGSTDPTLLLRTGLLVDYYGTGTIGGFVRCNGRTIGNAASGASERANVDCLPLFTLLWSDPTLAVSGGRGATPSGDFAANKTVALPDFRARVRAGLARMGSDESPIMPGRFIEGGNNDLLGAVAGASEIAINVDQMPNHGHGAAIDPSGQHTHQTAARRSMVLDLGSTAVDVMSPNTTDLPSSGNHSHSISIETTGGNQPHYNIQPTKFVTVLIKL